jgi:hypothetical protein
MDVSIRAVNICFALDLLHSGDFIFEKEDEYIISSCLYDHGIYILEHLEWNEKRGNHYLADICGLVCIALHLPHSEETDKWISFCIGQLNIEIIRQFLADGGNFEGSIAYHRLSLEMVLYAVSFIMSIPSDRLEKIASIPESKYNYLPKDSKGYYKWDLHKFVSLNDGASFSCPFGPEVIYRLNLAVNFFTSVLKPDLTIPQVGDNDSGRFLKLHPEFDILTVRDAKFRFINLLNYTGLPDSEIYYFENGLSGRHIFNIAGPIGFFNFNVENISNFNTLESTIISCLINGKAFHVDVRGNEFQLTSKLFINANKKSIVEGYEKCENKKIKYFQPKAVENNLRGTFTSLYFKDFGIFILKNKNFYLLLRCITESGFHGGHFHEDQLCMELEVNKVSITRDPGTFIYTALPQYRNLFRSASQHFSLYNNLEAKTKKSDENIFNDIELIPAEVCFFNNNFIVQVKHRNKIIGKLIQINSDEISIVDYSNFSLDIIDIMHSNPSIYYSAGYGILETTSVNGAF